MLKFINANQDDALKAIYKRLKAELLAHKRVLWLISGGSNITLELKIMNLLVKNVSESLSSLAIMPIDERYGKHGHKDSNIQQLIDTGFSQSSAVLVDVLIHNLAFNKTVSFYDDAATTALTNADVVVGQIGMGSDGHILGIKPTSPACTDDSAMVVGYKWDDYDRMTLSIAALKKINVAFMPAYGSDKAQKLHELQQNKSSVQELPAELLYEINEVYVYNDQVGGKL